MRSNVTDPVPMTKREKELMVVLILTTIALDNANPDVGVGPSIHSIATEINNHLDLPLNERDLIECIDMIENNKNHRWKL